MSFLTPTSPPRPGESATCPHCGVFAYFPDSDFDKSGAWYLLVFVPFANFVMGLVLLLAPATRGPNQYGTR